MSPDRLVLYLGLAGGLLLVFVTPPFQVPDEPAHFLRIYQIATAAPVVTVSGEGTGCRLPASLPRLAALCTGGVAFHPERRLPPGLLAAAWRVPLAPERRVFLGTGSFSVYSPAPYLAAAAAVAAGSLAGAPPLALLYLARLANLAAALAVSWAAVRIAPVQRWLLALLALTPMAMFERSSASADALTNALGLLLVGCLLSLALRPPAGEASHPRSETSEASCGRRYVLLLATGLLLAASKGVYFVLDLLVLLVPRSVRARGATTALWAGGGVVAAAGLGVSWWQLHRYLPPPASSGFQPLAQLRGVMAAPLRFAALAAKDYVVHAPRYAAELVGNFGWLDTPLPRPAAVLWGLLLLATAAVGGDPARALAAWQRWLAAAAAGATLLLVSLSQYVTWTPLGAGFVDGIQGRYLLPLAPVAAFLFYSRRLAARWQGGRARAAWLLGGAGAAYTVLTLFCIWFRYHGVS